MNDVIRHDCHEYLSSPLLVSISLSTGSELVSRDPQVLAECSQIGPESDTGVVAGHQALFSLSISPVTPKNRLRRANIRNSAQGNLAPPRDPVKKLQIWEINLAR